MSTYSIETKLEKDGTLLLSNLPFEAGATVEVVVSVQQSASSQKNRYPLRGTPITSLDPTEPVRKLMETSLRKSEERYLPSGVLSSWLKAAAKRL